MARCFMQLKQHEQALKHANEAKIRESNLATHFLLFLVHLHVPDDEKGAYEYFFDLVFCLALTRSLISQSGTGCPVCMRRF
jgi:hypothetical protein